jgi:hypothetical protein
MVPMRPANPVHVPILLLWEFSKGKTGLGRDQKAHLQDCPECIRVLGLCSSSMAMAQVERIVEEGGCRDSLDYD